VQAQAAAQARCVERWPTLEPAALGLSPWSAAQASGKLRPHL
jgi:hypothetical protein